MVTRLSGGLTPADGADPRTFPAIWNSTATDIESLQSSSVTYGTAITALQGSAVALGSAVDVIEAWDLDDLNDVTVTSPSDGQVLAYSTAVSGWVNEDAAGGAGFALSTAVYYTGNATWTKADYTGIKAIKVRVQGAGGGGGNNGGTNNAASGGGAGGYAERFILEGSLSATESVVVGSGGAGGSSGGASSGTTGGTSSFASGEAYQVIGTGGSGSSANTNTSPGLGQGGTGALVLEGGSGAGGSFSVTNTPAGQGGSSHLGQGGAGGEAFTGLVRNGSAAKNYGGGGGGSFNTGAGGAGSNGIVIVEVYV